MPTHIVSGRSVGLSDTLIAHLADDPLPKGVYSDVERAVVEYARRLTRMEPIDDELYGRLASSFTTPAIIELCLVVGSANLVNRFHATFHTDVDERFGGALETSCPLPLPATGRRSSAAPSPGTATGA